MFQNEKIDLRVKYTREWTYIALEKILELKLYNEITITEIIKKAGISRATFYRNFSSKDDIIEFKVKSFFTTFYNDLIDYYKLMNSSDELELIGQFFKRISNESNLIGTIIKANVGYMMVQNIVQVIETHRDLFYNVLGYEESTEKYIIEIVSSSAWTLLSTWYQNGKIETSEELAQIYVLTFKTVSIALFGNKDDLNKR
ncbi:MAG: TetR/AcrR family transcriptional regulator [Candidatus Izemoplasma sp.]